jgi:hypothetical protein
MTKIEAFKLIDEEGNLYHAAKITPIKNIRGTHEKFIGLPHFKLTTGEHLNQDGDDFKVVESGLKLKQL